MAFNHTSVLFSEAIDHLNIKPDGIYVDGTLGGGGHAGGICGRLSSDGLLIGIDRDKDALSAAKLNLESYNCRKVFVHDNYANIKEILAALNIDKIDGALLDLGVSSFQLDNEERGFSYMKPAPLDMRMNAEDHLTAKEVINTYTQKELTEVIRNYGEERWAFRIAEFILKARQAGEVETTDQLVDIIKSAIPAAARRDGPHPAKRTFQAIRIEVNDELGKLELAITEYLDVLAPKGRLCVITFHSLEDRIVKELIHKRIDPCTCPKSLPLCVCGKKPDVKKITGKPILPSSEEIALNPRAEAQNFELQKRNERSSHMLTAEKWYQHQEKYVKYGIDMRPAAKQEEEILPDRRITLSGHDRLKLIILVFIIGALCIAGVVTTAYATQVKYNINAIVQENAVIQGEIENLDVAIESANNIKIIEEKAVSQLGMVYPEYEQMVFIAEVPDKINDFASVLREQAYN